MRVAEPWPSFRAALLEHLDWLTRSVEDEEGREDSYALELAVRPGGKRQVAACYGFHGEWLEWRGR